MKQSKTWTVFSLLIAMYLTGCVSTNAPTSDPSCFWVEPLSWHGDDTSETKEEIFRHNLMFEEMCE